MRRGYIANPTLHWADGSKNALGMIAIRPKFFQPF
jgi:hypothetical protein